MIDSNYHNPESIDFNRSWQFRAVRIGMVIVALSGILINSYIGFALPSMNVECIADYTFIYTSSLNQFFNENSIYKNFLLIFSGLCSDLLIISLGVMWIVFGKSWRLIISLIVFYLLKCMFHFLFQVQIPLGYLWDYPGFPSISRSYLNTNDFFFSAPVGMLTIACLEIWKKKNYFIFTWAIIVLIVESFTRILLRGNYICDIFSAIIIAHFIFIICDEYCPKYIDLMNNRFINMGKGEDNAGASQVPVGKEDEEM